MDKNTCSAQAQGRDCFPFLLRLCPKNMPRDLTWKYICLQSTCFSPLKSEHIVFIEIKVMELAAPAFFVFYPAKCKQNGLHNTACAGGDFV